MNTTVGQLIINDLLPPKLRDYSRILDKKNIQKLLVELYKEDPGKYREVVHDLTNLSWHVAQDQAGFSFGPEHFQYPKKYDDLKQQLKNEIYAIYQDPKLNQREKEQLAVKRIQEFAEKVPKQFFQELLEAGNPIAEQVHSGSRGNLTTFTSLLLGDLLVVDHKDRPVPFPILRPYAKGLKPAEYWSASYGVRKGLMGTRLSTQDGGALAKYLAQVSHRLVVAEEDFEHPRHIKRGVPESTDNDEIVGQLLAAPVLNYQKNAVITPQMLEEFRNKGIKEILVRSPIISDTPIGGLTSRDVGAREFGQLPSKGENVGIIAAQSIGEPIAQMQISAKHSGGVAASAAMKGLSGFEVVQKFLSMPRTSHRSAVHATTSGTVDKIEELPTGGWNVSINGVKHYVPPILKITIQKGDTIEAGDQITDGIPNPVALVETKGIGEGRRLFSLHFKKLLSDLGFSVHKRNTDVLARALINHAEITEPFADYLPGDIVPFHAINYLYEPRKDHQELPTDKVLNYYLEVPVLHYTIGTRLTPSMIKTLKNHGVDKVIVHKDPPPFRPRAIRIGEQLTHDPDWMTRQYGSYLKLGLMNAAWRGSVSDPSSTSFVPGLAMGGTFGKILQAPQRTHQPQPPKEAPPIKPPLSHLPKPQ